MTNDQDPITSAAIGAAMIVHRTLGFLKAAYQEALEYEFIVCGLPYTCAC